MKLLAEVIKAFECCEHGEPYSNCEECSYVGIGACCLERENDAIHYLNAYRQLSQGFVGENTEIRPEGIYCKVCGTRLDKDWDDEDAG